MAKIQAHKTKFESKKGPNSDPKSSKSRPGTLGKFRPKMAKIQAHKTKFEGKKGVKFRPKILKIQARNLRQIQAQNGQNPGSQDQI